MNYKNRYFSSFLHFLLTMILTSGLLPGFISVQAAPLAATYTVTNTNDSGDGSLRAAIDNANTNPGADTITFSVSGIITLVTELPEITDDETIIDASSQWSGVWPDGSPGITLDGTNLNETRKGIYINANYCQVRGLFIKNFSADESHGIFVWGAHNTIGGTGDGMRNVVSGNKYGITIHQSSYNEVLGNYLGVDSDGTTDLGNNQSGVSVSNGSYYNVIGGTTEAARNVIAGNDVSGISISGSNTTVQGNYIGTDKNGTTALPNTGDGIVIYGHYNTIGGTAAGAGNVISGNGDDGIDIYGGDNNDVLGNYIGTDVNGTADLGNTGTGIYIHNSAQNNTVGGASVGAGNLISGNNASGIYITGSGTTGNQVLGNYVGTDVNGTADLGNTSVGVYITGGAQNNTVGGTSATSRNILSGNDHSGVFVSGSGTTGNQVLGNYIGTDVNGTADLGNTFYGVWVVNGAQSNTIGGTSDGAGNVISGNDASGLAISGSGTNNNVVEGNYIGTAANGTTARKNEEHGVIIYSGAQSNTIGGTVDGSRNIISGNGYSGVTLENTGTSNNTIQGNYIGIDVNGNYRANIDNGVYVRDAANNNTIGGASDSARNVISCNQQAGVRVGRSGYASVSGTIIQGNYIGTDPTGELDKGNSYDGVYIQEPSDQTQVLDNLISGNGDDGIDVQDGTNTIQGNIIGADKDKQTGISNDDGIYIDSDGNTIGGTVAGEGNFIGWNRGEGIQIKKNNNTIYGNTIFHNEEDGIDIRGYGEHADNNTIGGTGSGQANSIYENGANGVYVYGVNESEGYDFRYTDYNTISGNSIYDNTNLGIDLVGSGNGSGTDPSISAPALSVTSINGNTLHVEGSGAGADAGVEVFKADDVTSGEGKTYLGSLAADGSGNFSGDLDVTGLGISAGDSATATTIHTDNNTSEFSAVKTVTEAGTIISAQTGNWGDGSTWEGGVVPSATDNAVVFEGHTVTVNASQNCKKLTLKQNSILKIDDSMPSTTAGYDFHASSTVEYSKVGDQTIASTPAYGHLTASGSGTKTAEGSLTIGGDLTLNDSIAFNSSHTIDTGGSLTVQNNAAFSPSGAVNIGGNVTVQNNAGFNPSGSTDIVGSLTLSDDATAQNNAQLTIDGSLDLQGSSTFTLGDNLDVNTDITIGDGTTLNGGSYTINLAGNWSNNGTWNYGTGTVILDEPASDQTIGPSSSGSEVEIGVGTYDLNRYPFNNFYENNKTQMLYLSSEIGSAGTINGIQFNLNAISPEGYRDFVNFTVKLKETTESNWNNKGSYADMTGATMVFSQNPYTMPGSTGWFTISFNTPFSYGGSNNLIVEITWGDNGTYTSTKYELWATDLGSGNERVLYGYADSETPPNFDNEDDELPNIKFNFQGGGDKHFYNLTVSTAGSPGTTTPQAGIYAHNNLVVDSGSELVMGENALTVDGTLTNNGGLRQTKDVTGSADVTFLSTGGYGGLTLNANGSDLGSTDVTIKGNQDCTTTAGETVRRCYDITPTNTSGLNATLTFYFAGDELSGNTCSTLDVYHWNSTSSIWESLTTGTRSCSAEPYSIQATGVSDFSPFALKDDGSAPTSVTLVDFRTELRSGIANKWLALWVVLLVIGSTLAWRWRRGQSVQNK